MNFDLLAEKLSAQYGQGMPLTHDPDAPAPANDTVQELVTELFALLFPGYFSPAPPRSPAERLTHLHTALTKEMHAAYRYAREDDKTEATCEAFLATLPDIRSRLLKDVEAIFCGDSAARLREEVLICYPGFFAIGVYRMAHELHRLEVPLLPRMMTEYAHRRTGIDIHPGATIGEYFFIDHGTGTVIGETTVIGDHVKLYQGVTLGAKSFETDESGHPVKGVKRHPNIGDRVVIYANATILGGSTTVGNDCVIGGNVWLTHSLEAGTTLVYTGKAVHAVK